MYLVSGEPLSFLVALIGVIFFVFGATLVSRRATYPEFDTQQQPKSEE
jgi:hypothetical protein